MNKDLPKFKIKIEDEEFDQYKSVKIFNEKDNKIIGYVNFSIKDKTAWLSKIKVEDEYKFKGFGNKLIELFEKICKQYNVFKIEGKYYPESENAKQFYLNRGYDIYNDDYQWYILKFLYNCKKTDLQK